MNATNYNGAHRKRLINEVRNEIRILGLEIMFESSKRFVKTSAVSILLNNKKSLVADYSVSQMSDLLTQAGDSPI
jgi:hypothetical protein